MLLMFFAARRIAVFAWAAAASVAAAQSPTGAEVAPPSEFTNTSCKAQPGGDPERASRAMFDYINEQRVHFAKHLPYEGYPWLGGYVQTALWPVKMMWDEGLAARARAEAARLAAGGSPMGKRFRHQRFGLYGDRAEEMWLRGSETEEYEVVGRSRVATEPDDQWHAPGNGTMRLAVLYQTGAAGQAPKKRLGVGKACLSSGEAWWVLLFGP